MRARELKKLLAEAAKLTPAQKRVLMQALLVADDAAWFRALNRSAQTPGKPAPLLTMPSVHDVVTKQRAKSQKERAPLAVPFCLLISERPGSA